MALRSARTGERPLTRWLLLKMNDLLATKPLPVDGRCPRFGSFAAAAAARGTGEGRSHAS